MAIFAPKSSACLHLTLEPTAILVLNKEMDIVVLLFELPMKGWMKRGPTPQSSGTP